MGKRDTLKVIALKKHFTTRTQRKENPHYNALELIFLKETKIGKYVCRPNQYGQSLKDRTSNKAKKGQVRMNQFTGFLPLFSSSNLS